MGIENESGMQAMGDLEKRRSAKIWIVTPRISPNGLRRLEQIKNTLRTGFPGASYKGRVVAADATPNPAFAAQSTHTISYPGRTKGARTDDCITCHHAYRNPAHNAGRDP
jgi:hypothetical protein